MPQGHTYTNVTTPDDDHELLLFKSGEAPENVTASSLRDNYLLIDEDDMASDSAVKAPTQQSAKAYTRMSYEGASDYNNSSILAADDRKAKNVTASASATIDSAITYPEGFEILLKFGLGASLKVDPTTAITYINGDGYPDFSGVSTVFTAQAYAECIKLVHITNREWAMFKADAV